MDAQGAYRIWLWRRLALLVPSWLLAAAANLWLARAASGPLWMRLACLPLALLFLGLIGFFLLQTIRCGRHHGLGRSADARGLRRELRPCSGVVLSSLVLLAGLVAIPELFRKTEAATLGRMRRGMGRSPAPLEVAAVREDRGARFAIAADEDVAPPAPPEAFREATEHPPSLPAPLGRAPLDRPAGSASPPGVREEGRPEIEPPIDREPVALERDAGWSLALVSPAAPPPGPAPMTVQDDDPRPLRQRPTFDDPWVPFRDSGAGPRPVDRPLLPEEFDPTDLPAFELRVDVLLFVCESLGRIPAINAELNLPLAPDDSFVVSWLGARFPSDDLESRPDHDLTPNWDHLTFAYLRRLLGYTRHAAFDLAVSGGVDADFLGTVRGFDTAGLRPLMTPYLGIDAAYWQEGSLGLLVHLGESVPVTYDGASLGITDLSVELRDDVSTNMSFHLGYRILFVRSRGNSPTGDPSQDRSLVKNLGGPSLGVDVRF